MAAHLLRALTAFAAVLADHALGDVAQRQEGDALVALVLRHDQVVAAHGVDEARVRMHRALGPTGGAGGVDEDREILRLHGGDARLERTGMRLRMHAAEFAQGHQVDHAGVGEIAQALHVHDDDLAQPRQ